MSLAETNFYSPPFTVILPLLYNPNPRPLEERAKELSDTSEILMMLNEIQHKIEELTRKIAKSVEVDQEQVKIFADQSPTQSSKMIDRTVLRQIQLREEMVERKENLTRLQAELEQMVLI